MVKRERGSFREVLFLSLSLSLSLFLSENLKRGGEIFIGWSQARERHTMYYIQKEKILAETTFQLR